jgi:hypothetical protein
MINRRAFISALFVAPAIISAANIMPIWVPRPKVIELLDDYEIGTFTPALDLAIGDFTSVGNYTRLGNNVYLTSEIITTRESIRHSLVDIKEHLNGRLSIKPSREIQNE